MRKKIKKMSDERLALLLFDIGFILMLISMVIGPFGITRWALTTAVVACFLALAAIAIGFQGWDENPEEDNVPPDRIENSREIRR
jgi:hypothetical protein